MNGGGIEAGRPAFEQAGTHLRRHVRGLDDVFHADRHPVDGRQRRAFFPALCAGIGGRARGVELQEGEGLNVALALLDFIDAGIQKFTRRLSAGGKGAERLCEGAGNGLVHQAAASARVMAAARACSASMDERSRY